MIFLYQKRTFLEKRFYDAMDAFLKFSYFHKPLGMQ